MPYIHDINGLRPIPTQHHTPTLPQPTVAGTNTGKPMLIGLIGAPGAGKDTVAGILREAGFDCTAFAYALRDEIANAWQIDESLLTRRHTKELPLERLAAGRSNNAQWLDYCARQGWCLAQARSARWLMQSWGEWRRMVDHDHWTKCVAHWIRANRELLGVVNLVVTDVRHINEAELVRSHGGYLVRVHRVGHDVVLAGDTMHHVSEGHTGLRVDDDIHNDGTLVALASETMRVWRRLLGHSKVAGWHA